MTIRDKCPFRDGAIIIYLLCNSLTMCLRDKQPDLEEEALGGGWLSSNNSVV